MVTLVQKYGGSSLATRERIQTVAERIDAARHAADRVAVVVSAMGDTTDDLIETARRLSSRPPLRELDFLVSTGEIVSASLMVMALHELGCKAVALSGPQAGFDTDGRYGRARVLRLDPRRVQSELAEGRVPVVAGFQGQSPDGDIVTIGRGGSDASAVALAVAIGADRCEIYTDVDGIYTADPRLVPSARMLHAVLYEEMLEMAKLGARVLHPRAVEIAQRFSMPLVVRSSFSDSLGTQVVAEGAVDIETAQRVRAVTHDSDVARVTVRGVTDRPGLAHSLFQPLADRGISVDVIVQNVSEGGVTDISFTVARDDMDATLELVRPIAGDIGARDVLASDAVAKVSSVGVGMQTTPGIAARMFGALSDAGINIVGITTSEIRITCLIDAAEAERAAKAVHAAFDLDVAAES